VEVTAAVAVVAVEEATVEVEDVAEAAVVAVVDEVVEDEVGVVDGTNDT